MHATRAVASVDLREHRSGDPERRRRFARALRASLEATGFVRVSGHGVETALVRRAYAAFEAFFAQDAERKARWGGVAGGQRGYTPPGVERAVGHDAPDPKEFFHIGQELPTGHPLRDVYPENVWPDAPPDLRMVGLALYRRLEAASAALLEAIASAFDLPPATFASMIRDGNSILRVLHYPPVASGAGTLRAAPHEDINLVTLLCEATDGGLEIRSPQGDWIAVDGKPGEIIADAGDMLARVSNGVVPSTTHRVVTPPGAPHPRFALPFFAHPRPDCDLSVLPAFVPEGEAPRFPPITGGAFLEQRLREIGLL